VGFASEVRFADEHNIYFVLVSEEFELFFVVLQSIGIPECYSQNLLRFSNGC
jgi:hypothetical protein